MDIEATYKSIRSIYQTLSGKGDTDVTMTYKGNGYGLTTPWHARVGDRETLHETHDGALVALMDMLKKELSAKATSTEQEAKRLRLALNQLDN